MPILSIHLGFIPMHWKRVKKIDVDYNLNITISLAEARLIQKAFERPLELQGNILTIPKLGDLFPIEKLVLWKQKHPFADKIWDFVKQIEEDEFTP